MTADVPGLPRRDFLQLVGLGTVATRLGACAEAEPEAPGRSPAPTAPWPDAAPEGPSAFPEGVSCGDPSNDQLTFWTRYVGAGTPKLALALWDGSAWEATRSVSLQVADGGFIHVHVDGLPPDTHVAYQFVDDAGTASAVGRAVSPPATDVAAPVVIGVGSCYDQDHKAFPVLTHVVGRGPMDALLFLGDTAYFDDLDDRDAFRALYARNLTAPGFTEALPATACVYMFDDHEFDNDFDAERITPERFRLGMDSFLEHLPVRPDLGNPDRVWRSLRLGGLVEIFLVDGRTERRTSEEQFLSPTQLTWLIDGVTTSTARWKLIATGVPFADFSGTGWETPLLSADKWAGFPRDRARLLQALDDTETTGVLFLSGDVHAGFLGRVAVDGPGADRWEICCGPGGSFLNPLAGLLLDDPRFVWAQGVWNAVRLGFTVKDTVIIEVIGEENQDWARFELAIDGTLLSSEILDPSSQVNPLR